MKLKCMIVDDEPVSRDVLRKYISDIPGLELLGECKDAFEAKDFLATDHIDLLFLDINMPRVSGVSFARSLTKSPMIVFTTAYPEYAVEGFELNAIDYLVKPFSFERFLKAVNKAQDRKEEAHAESPETTTILLKADKKIHAIKQENIELIEGLGDYIKVHISGKNPLVVHDTMKGFLETLASDKFMRIHKSYTIQLSLVEYIEGNQVVISGQKIPISPTFRQELLDRLK